MLRGFEVSLTYGTIGGWRYAQRDGIMAGAHGCGSVVTLCISAASSGLRCSWNLANLLILK
jgi:hypothetical protein